VFLTGEICIEYFDNSFRYVLQSGRIDAIVAMAGLFLAHLAITTSEDGPIGGSAIFASTFVVSFVDSIGACAITRGTALELIVSRPIVRMIANLSSVPDYFLVVNCGGFPLEWMREAEGECPEFEDLVPFFEMVHLQWNAMPEEQVVDLVDFIVGELYQNELARGLFLNWASFLPDAMFVSMYKKVTNPAWLESKRLAFIVALFDIVDLDRREVLFNLMQCVDLHMTLGLITNIIFVDA
jgi:hypothetical protein